MPVRDIRAPTEIQLSILARLSNKFTYLPILHNLDARTVEFPLVMAAHHPLISQQEMDSSRFIGHSYFKHTTL
jgi:hypothetical protein